MASQLKGSLFRSEEMTLVQLFIQAEAARATVQELGDLGLVQFRDLNPEVNSFQRTFVNEIRRCEEMERKLRYLQDQLAKTDIKVIDDATRAHRQPNQQEFDALDAKLTEYEADVKQINANEEQILRNSASLTELKSVLLESQQMFSNQDMPPSMTTDDEPLLGADEGTSSNMSSVSGVINRDRVASFERVLWRALRGNVLFRHTQIATDTADTDDSAKLVAKDVIVIICPGEQMKAKVRRLCDSFGANLYQTPETPQARGELLDQVEQRLRDIRSVLARTEEHRRFKFREIADVLGAWIRSVHREKASYFALNLFSREQSSRCFVAEGWVPTCALNELQAALRRGCETARSHVPTVMNVVQTTETPPTFFFTNKFTAGFHALIESYGVATYREMNPSPYTIITFPFLFAVMFGDLGHAFMMTCAAALIVRNEKKLASWANDEMLGMIYGGRYIILLMGVFSMYTGLIYNDIFSKVMAIFPSSWTFVIDEAGNEHGVWTNTSSVYAFGLDHAWHGASNLLIFTNSYKMKMSIIFGIVQMSFGVVLSLFNHINFKRSISIYHEFIPQMIFLMSIFGYLCVMIIYKWSVDWYSLQLPPPSLLNMLINMILSPGKVDDYLYAGQDKVQIVLLVIAVLCVPWMLLVKPFYIRAQHKKSSHYRPLGGAEVEPDSEANHGHGGDAHSEGAGSGDHGGGDHGGHGGEFDFGEIMIHQVIHTIEFVLGSVSNTASYLRLWALSLAHAQLSEVLWSMTIGSFTTGPPALIKNGIGLVGGVTVWVTLTIGILICMEGLSAFLHALRLHWVEFDSKFYGGAGYAFKPFSYKRTDNGDEE